MVAPPKVAVIVASLGRPDAVALLLDRLARQSLLPHRTILSVEKPADLPPVMPDTLNVEVIIGPRGSSVQRNRGLDRLGEDADFIAIFDDDYVPSLRALEGILRGFEVCPDASGLCGELLADGASGPGVDPESAIAMVDAEDAVRDPQRRVTRLPGVGVYGCNMVFRRPDIGDVRFDESLPLYGWLEDSDFGARLPGPVIYCDAFFGVHCAVKSGREKSGVRQGYSQVMNPVYLQRKGTLSAGRALKLVLRPFAANLMRTRRPEPWIDRAGRLRGNLLAFGDLLRGRITPQRITSL